VKSIVIVVILLSLLISSITAQEKSVTLSGYVKDGKSGEVLIGATIYVDSIGKGATTNLYGYYSLTIPQGTYTVRYSFIGFEDLKKQIVLTADQRVSVDLLENSKVMKEVVIEGKANQNTESTQMGQVELNVEKIKSLPAFMGEVDILKTIQLLPGVQSAGEGNTGFYVRGGGPDQNLILLDEAPVYNASHLFGFFSVFNADALKNVNMIKGGMPANYGGRLSSVLDISMKDGNYKEYHAEGGIGLIASRFTAEGPIKKDTSSFIISGRRTYVDVVAAPFIKEDAPLKGSGYYFYDLTAKLNYKISDNDRLFLSGYFGRDVFTYNNKTLGLKFQVPWGNATGSLRWNHLFTDKLFVNTTAIFTDYNFAFSSEFDDFKFSIASGIRDWNLKQDYSYFHNTFHTFKFGWNYIYHRFIPTSFSASAGDVDFGTDDPPKILAHEAAGYILDEFSLNENLKINAGLRFSMFQQVGPFTRYYKNSSTGTVDSTRTWNKGDRIQYYDGFEPRLAIRYSLPDKSSIKAGFSHNYQYVHMASISSVSLPTDLWFPSSELIKPQIGTQYSAGYFRNFKKNMFETSVEVYYKNMQNMVEYKENAQPEDNVEDNIDNQLTFGRGYSYGAELFLKKTTGDFNGWIGYTWSKTMRIFDEIDNGLPFPAKYDRRHDLSVALQYDITERLNVGVIFVYATGNAISLPERRTYSFFENRVVTVWSTRNGHRMVPYHRLDFSLTYKGKEFKTVKNVETGEEEQRPKKLISSWNFSVYNVYNRANPYFIFFNYSGDLSTNNIKPEAYQVSLFPILPSVTWNFKF
jgi:hypothetical protein